MSNFIIKHPNTFSLPAYNEEYRAGKINGLARQTCHKLVNISSCVRQLQLPSIFRPCNKIKDFCTDNTCGSCDNCCYLKKWSSTNFNVYLPETLDKVVKMSLSALEIPNTIYSISQLSSKLSLSISGTKVAVKSAGFSEYIVNFLSMLEMLPLQPLNI